MLTPILPSLIVERANFTPTSKVLKQFFLIQVGFRKSILPLKRQTYALLVSLAISKVARDPFTSLLIDNLYNHCNGWYRFDTHPSNILDTPTHTFTNIHLLQFITATPNYRFQVNPQQLERGEFLKSFEILIKESFNNITWYVFSPNLKFFKPFLHDISKL